MVTKSYRYVGIVLLLDYRQINSSVIQYKKHINLEICYAVVKEKAFAKSHARKVRNNHE